MSKTLAITRNTLTISIFFILSTLFSCLSDLEDSTVQDDEDDTTADVVDETIDDALEENDTTHEDATDSTWSYADEVLITLDGSTISASSTIVTIDGTTVTLTRAGNYRLQGTLTSGQVIVNTEDEATTHLIFDGINITSTTTAPVSIMSAEKVVVYVEEGTSNYLKDGANYTFEGDADEPDATLFSKADCSIYGTGYLEIDANYNDAISSKDGLIIDGPQITINSVDDGIRGKDYLVLRNTTLIIASTGDGLKSDNDEEAGRGYIHIESGDYKIVSGGDGISAQSDLLVSGGIFTVKSGGGSSASVSSTTSAKGLKAVLTMLIENGDFTFNTADDALHANGHIVIEDGTFEISTGDDGVHADSSLLVKGGYINVTKSYEGLESAVIQVDGGEIHVVTSDDGINVAGGNDGSGTGGGGGFGQGGFGSSSGNYYMYINGGYITVNAEGDGLDANGSIVMTGGKVIVNGPTGNGNGALDYDGSFNISGGFLLAVGSSGMVQQPGSGSSQNSLQVVLTSSQSAGNLVRLQDSSGNALYTLKPAKKYQSVVFSSPDLAKSSYNMYLGGNMSGSTEADGLYEGGTYTTGTLYKSITITSTITSIGGR